jgi:hypothetical protein
MCGFEPVTKRLEDGSLKVYLAPSESAYSNFLANLKECGKELDKLFAEMVSYMYGHLEGLGECLMVDRKAIQSYATKPAKSKKPENAGDWCQKTCTVSGKNRESITKEFKWFGFRLHLIADAEYELPVAFKVTKASNS